MPLNPKTSPKKSQPTVAPSEKGPARKASAGHRGKGRPAGPAGGILDRAMILNVALQLTKTTSLVDLSIVRVAKELGVTPAAIHYYLAGGGRDALISGVMNLYYRNLIEQWPRETGDWRHRMEVVAEAAYRAHLRYPGVSMYIATNNRFQLVQDVLEGETDYGLLVFERFNATVRAAGFDAQRTGVIAHLFVMTISAYAHSTVTRRWPGQHSDFLSAKLSVLDPNKYPNSHFVKDSLIHLHPAQAFTTGLELFLNGLEMQRQRWVVPEAAKAR